MGNPHISNFYATVWKTMDKVVHCIHRQELSIACAFPTSMVCYKSVNTARDLTLWVYDFGSVTAMGA